GSMRGDRIVLDRGRWPGRDFVDAIPRDRTSREEKPPTRQIRDRRTPCPPPGSAQGFRDTSNGRNCDHDRSSRRNGRADLPPSQRHGGAIEAERKAEEQELDTIASSAVAPSGRAARPSSRPSLLPRRGQAGAGNVLSPSPA